MEQLGGVKLAFVSLELDEECVVKKGLSPKTDEKNQLKGEGAGERAGRSIDLSEIMNFSTFIDPMKEQPGKRKRVSTCQQYKPPGGHLVCFYRSTDENFFFFFSE